MTAFFIAPLGYNSGCICGEFIAVSAYGLKKASAGSNGYDCITAEGKSVQVKTNYAASQIGFRGKADLMLVLRVLASGEWEEVYYGPFELVEAASRYSARDNKKMVALSKLKAIKTALNVQGPQVAAKVAETMPDETLAPTQE